MAFAVNPAIFRAYDIRGIVDRDLTTDVYQTLGRAAGTYYRQRSAQRIAVARDARLTSPAFSAALIEGLQSTGCDVVDLGMVPTPVMYFAVSYLKLDGGAIVSASHNPPEFNGLKLRRAEPRFGGEPLDGAAIQQLEQLANGGEFAIGAGGYEQIDVSDAYVASVAKHLRLPHPVKVVLDGGNGVAGPIGVRAFEAIGCEVVPLFIEPDGRFPNHHPDPLKEENLVALKAKVLETGAAIGIGLDGDGDRLGVINSRGEMVFADQYMIALAKYLLRERPGPVIFDVKCSAVLPRAIRDFGGTPVMWKTGYTNGSAKMRELDAPLAGELSGHIFANLPNHSHDDGTFAGCQLLLALAELDETLDEVLAPYPPLPSLSEGRIHCDDTLKFKLIDYLHEQLGSQYEIIDVDGLRIEFGDGWGLVRASNTEPAITTRFEAETMERAQAIRTLLLGHVQTFFHQVGVEFSF
jgi:phosphomannomutase